MPSPAPSASPAPAAERSDPNQQWQIDSSSTLHSPVRPPACRVLVVYAHAAPHASRVNRVLAQAAAAIDGVWVDDLYETYPDFYIDVARERSLLAGAHALVLLFPTQWYAAPALLKEWLDVVLPDAWRSGAGPHRDGAAPPPGLPRRCWIVTSTGSAAADFVPGGRHGHCFDDLLKPLMATARVCGMEILAPLVLYGAHQVDGAAVDAHVARFASLLGELARSGPPARRAAPAMPAEMAQAAPPLDAAPAPLAAPMRVPTGGRRGD